MPRKDRNHDSTTIGNDAGAASLFGNARGQILSVLCGRRLTASELAERFAISSNAIRTHLSALHGVGLVRYEPESRGVGKPTHVYELTPEGQYLLSRAYAPALASVLRAARARVPDGIDAILRDAGRALASVDVPHGAGKTSLRAKAERCAAILRSLGGSAEVAENTKTLVIHSECCPLASVVTDQPAACKLFEAMAREVTGHTVQERCDRASRPHCQFVIAKSSGN